MGDVVNDTFNKVKNGVGSIFNDALIQALIILLVAFILSFLVSLLQSYLEIDDESPWGQFLEKLSEGFVFIGSAGLTGFILTLLSRYRSQVNNEIKPTIVDNGMTYERVVTYIPMKQEIS